MISKKNTKGISLVSVIGPGLLFVSLGLILWLLPGSFDSHRTPGTQKQKLARTSGTVLHSPDKEANSFADERASYARLPLSFEPNQGQANQDVQFLSRGQGYSLFLTSNEAVLALSKTSQTLSQVAQEATGNRSVLTAPKKTERTIVKMKLVGASATSVAEELEELPGKVNYLIGADSRSWRTEIPTYGKIKYKDVYPGIDLVYYGNQQQLEYDFVVAPGKDLHQIQISIVGAKNLQIDSDGTLLLRTTGGEIRQERPVVYQVIDGSRRSVPGEYILKSKETIGFKIGPYETDKPLIIDPVLVYSRYLGGVGTDFASSLAVDATGNVYVSGWTSSIDFPVTHPQHIGSGGGFDAFVSKLNSAGTGLVYSTYIGGDGDDYGSGIALDNANGVFIAGMTESANFPTTATAFQPNFAGNGSCLDDGGFLRPCRDGFITKLDSIGSTIIYSTYLGGTADEWCNAIALDATESAYVTGQTNSTNFPASGSFQTSYGGGRWDAFLTKISPAGTTLSYSTYLGGSNRDYGFDVTVDGIGNAYVTGETASTDFPVQNALQGTYGGGIFDAFVSKINAPGSSLVYSTYFGGNAQDIGAGIALDLLGNSYISLQTDSQNLPVSPGAFQTTLGGSTDAYVVKLNPAGSNLVYASYLGGSGDDYGYFIAVDSFGRANITGYTSSNNFPTVDSLQPTYGGGVFEAFVTTLNSDGSAILSSTFLGGAGLDRGFDIALDNIGNVYVTGVTDSVNFIGTSSSVGGGLDAFVVKIGATTSPTPTPTPLPTETALVSFPYVGQQSDTIIFGHADVADAVAQSFKLSVNSKISSINVIIWRGSVNDGVRIRLSSNLTDTLAISDVVSASQLGTTLTTQWTTFTFSPLQQPVLPANISLFFILERTGPLGAHQSTDYYVNLRASNIGATYADGRYHFLSDGNWVAQDDFDAFFELFSLIETPTPTPLPTPAPSPSPSPAPMSWQKLSGPWTPDCDNSFNAIAIDPKDSNTIYLGSSHQTKGCGLYKSTDAGQNWFEINRGFSKIGIGPFRHYPSVSRIVVASSNSAIVYAGTLSGTVYRSSDGGLTWAIANGNRPRIGNPILDIAVDPVNSDVLYVGLGFGGVYKTLDGGANWKQVRGASAAIGVSDFYTTVRISPSDRHTVFASGFTSYNATLPLCSRQGCISMSGVLPLGPYKTVNGGLTWLPIAPPRSKFVPNVAGITISALLTDLIFDPQNSNILYGSTIAYSAPVLPFPVDNAGVFKTTNGGVSWQSISTAGNVDLTQLPIYELAIDHNAPAHLFAVAGFNGVFTSVNGGMNWERLTKRGLSPDTFVGKLGVTTARLYAVTSSGIYSLSVQ